MLTQSEDQLERASARDVPRDQWRDVLNELSERLRGWRATIEVRGHGMHRARVGHGLPLQGLSHELEGSEAGDVMIETGDAPDFYFVHHIDRPRTLRVTEPTPRCPAELEIESDDGRTTFIRLRNTRDMLGGGARFGEMRAQSTGWAPMAIAAAAGFAVGTVAGMTLAEARQQRGATRLWSGGSLRRRAWSDR